MSLTSELRSARSPIRAWFEEHLPAAHDLTVEVSAASRSARADLVVPCAHGDPGTAGTAFDFRARYYFGVTPPDQTAAWRGATRLAERDLLEREGSMDFAHRVVRDAEWPKWRDWMPGFVMRESDVPTWMSVTWAPRGLGFASARLGDSAFSDSLPRKFFEYLETLVGRTVPVGRRLGPADEAELCRACIVLAWYEQVYRAGIRPESPLERLRPNASLEDLLGVVPETMVEDVGQLSRVTYERFRDQLQRPAILNPVFAGSIAIGGADADLILDGCLLELKTASKPGLNAWWFYQLVGYALLDWEASYQLDSIGLYLVRRDWLATWPLDGLLSALGARARIPSLRRSLRSFLEGSRHAFAMSGVAEVDSTRPLPRG